MNASSFEVIPAIDIKGGKCVRLFQGDYSKETVYSNDPVQVALSWQEQGARRLHVVDLDGAASGIIHNLPVIEGILKAVSVPVQVGGGIRDMETVTRLLGIGAGRVILGTTAVEDPALVKEAAARFTDAIAVAIDGRKGLVATRGWTKDTAVRVVDLVKGMVELGAHTFICTDIGRDGTLTEPNFAAIQEVVSCASAYVIASGGIASLEQVRRLKEMGCGGAIIGMALYQGHIKLREALKV